MKVRHDDREIGYSPLLLHAAVIITITYDAITYAQDTFRTLGADQSEPLACSAFVAYALVMLTASGTLAYLNYRYMESPFIRYKPK